MKKLLNIILASMILSGCASNVRENINRYEREISSSQHNILILESEIAKENDNIRNYKSSISASEESIKKYKENIDKAKNGLLRARSYLSENSDVFINGQCKRPSLGPQPRPYCESWDEAKEHALAYCSMSAGCDATILFASDELDTFSKRFLASETCSRMVSELQDEGYSPDATAVNALEALSDTGCNNEGSGFFSAIIKGLGCVMSASIKLAKINSYINCTERKAKACYSSYTNWQNKPEKRQRECTVNVKNIAIYKNDIPKYEKWITVKLSSIQGNKKKIENSSNTLSVVKQSLEREKDSHERYTRLLEKTKNTFAYELYVK